MLPTVMLVMLVMLVMYFHTGTTRVANVDESVITRSEEISCDRWGLLIVGIMGRCLVGCSP